MILRIGGHVILGNICVMFYYGVFQGIFALGGEAELSRKVGS